MQIGNPRTGAVRRLIPASLVVLCLQILCLLVPPLLYGQVKAVDASLSGTVTDASGALVANARVRLSNPNRGLDFKATTSADGRYTFALVPPDAGYELTVEATGFSSFRQVGLTLTVGQSAELNVPLQLGKASVTVEVSGDAPLLNTQDANIGAEVNERAIVELPLSTRNLLSLLSLDSSVQPGVNLQQVPGLGSLADQDLSFLNFGGQRFGTTAYLVDGMYDTGGDWGGVIYTPSVEETEEFRVQSNSYSAQYGWSTGNVVSMVTKSGTRDLHGDLWEFLRNEDLEANNFFNNLNGIPRQKDRQNQFGGTIGGPVYIPGLYRQRDKTFFFFSLERIERTSPYSITTTMPLDAWKQGNFSGMLGGQIGTDAEGRPILANEIYNPFSTRQVTGGQVDPVTGLTVSAAACPGKCYIRDPFAGNMIPSNLFDPVSRNLLKYWPSAQNQSLATNNFSFGGSETAHTQPLDVRIDHNINDRMRLFGKFAYKWVDFNDPPALFGNSPAGPANGHPNNRLLGGINFVDALSPTSTLSANVGITRWVEGRTPEGGGFLPSTLGFPSSLNIANNFPFVGFGGSPTYVYPLANNVNGNGATDRWPRENRTFGVDYSKVAGSHSISAGFTFINVRTGALDGNQASFNFGPNGTGGPNPLAVTSETGL